MKRFEEAYDPAKLSQVQQIIAIAASHHRLVWIHPFLDGNGRVVRLFSQAWLLETGIGSSLWSVSRGLARNVEEYKARLMAADAPRKGDLDGRGNLSHDELVNFCRFFLKTAVDQVEFMG
jgi:Fic family protein